jgi:hypothetical protein
MSANANVAPTAASGGRTRMLSHAKPIRTTIAMAIGIQVRTSSVAMPSVVPISAASQSAAGGYTNGMPRSL